MSAILVRRKINGEVMGQIRNFPDVAVSPGAQGANIREVARILARGAGRGARVAGRGSRGAGA
ncbi:hypothetical protein, partial [Micromonospora hortensis]|uniref:hypothetical protein n=1 Tax=Micromonospora hortensis TaxID=2911209 RepID=UPI001EE83096